MFKLQDRAVPNPELIANETNKSLLSWLRDFTKAVLFFMNDVRNLHNAGKQSILHLDIMIAEPDGPQAGMIAYADGVKWDPGTGEGAYVYTAGAWAKLH